MLTKLRLKGALAKRVGAKESRTFTFQPGVNLLIGPNGSGKSTILQAIMQAASDSRFARNLAKRATAKSTDQQTISSDLTEPDDSHDTVARDVEATVSGAVKVKSFDFEHQNPRTQSYIGDLPMFQFGSKFSSHGEVNRILNAGLLEDDGVKNSIVLLDEPDQALDFDGALELVQSIEACPAAQIIIAVHHPLVVLYENFHAIDLEKGYRDRVRKKIQTVLRAGEKHARV